MELSVTSEEMSDFAMLEGEGVNGDDDENSNADSAAAAEDVVLQLTVEDDSLSNSSYILPPAAKDSVVTKSNKYAKNMPSSQSEKISASKPVSRKTVSDATAAQATVFRQYLLDGDIQARILELDNYSAVRGEASIWDKLAEKMYGTVNCRLQKRMYMAWRRKRGGYLTVRDRVLSSLESEGILTFLNGDWSVSRSHVNTAADVQNHTDAIPSNYCTVTLSENMIGLSRRNISGETRNRLPVRRNSRHVNNCAIARNHYRHIVTRYKHQNNTKFNHMRHKSAIKSTISSHSVKAVRQKISLSCQPYSTAVSMSAQQKCQDSVSTLQRSCSSPSLTRQGSDYTTSHLELDDIDIQKAMDILKAHYPSIAGLEHVGLGTCIRGSSIPRFAAAGSRRFVQIVNVGDHWVCATNLFGETTSNVYVYDSLFGRVTPSLVIQISSILRLDNMSNSITFHIREFKQQKPGTRWCGYYAVAAAFAVCRGTDPTGTVYTVELLHDAVRQHLEAGSCGLLPATNCKLKRDVQTLTKQRLFCLCHKRAMGQMLQCERCQNQFHASCVAVYQLPLSSDGQLERGPCCAHVTDTL